MNTYLKFPSPAQADYWKLAGTITVSVGRLIAAQYKAEHGKLPSRPITIELVADALYERYPDAMEPLVIEPGAARDSYSYKGRRRFWTRRMVEQRVSASYKTILAYSHNLTDEERAKGNLNSRGHSGRKRRMDDETYANEVAQLAEPRERRERMEAISGKRVTDRTERNYQARYKAHKTAEGQVVAEAERIVHRAVFETLLDDLLDPPALIPRIQRLDPIKVAVLEMQRPPVFEDSEIAEMLASL